MITHVVLQIEPTRIPSIKKLCPKCRCNTFSCSGKFRVNAQKKNIDVWLIYKCENCNNTYNINILSRVKRESISSDIFEKFCKNDKNMVFDCSFNNRIIDKNKIKFDYTTLEYTISSSMKFEDILSGNHKFIKLTIEDNYGIKLKLSDIIKKYMNISSTQYKYLIAAEILTMKHEANTEKYQFMEKEHVIIHLCRLKKHLQEQQQYV